MQTYLVSFDHPVAGHDEAVLLNDAGTPHCPTDVGFWDVLPATFCGRVDAARAHPDFAAGAGRYRKRFSADAARQVAPRRWPVATFSPAPSFRWFQRFRPFHARKRLMQQRLTWGRGWNHAGTKCRSAVPRRRAPLAPGRRGAVG